MQLSEDEREEFGGALEEVGQANALLEDAARMLAELGHHEPARKIRGAAQEAVWQVDFAIQERRRRARAA